MRAKRAAATSAWSIRRRRAEDRAPEPEREVVFFAIGFETTTPPTALVVARRRAGLDNFSVLCCHVLTPAAITHPARRPAADAVPLDGFIGPAHVSIDRLGAPRASPRLPQAGGDRRLRAAT
jgi:hydrogenase maturation factor